MYEKIFVGGGARPNERRTVAKKINLRKTLRVQCEEGGAARKKCGPTAYRATSGRLAKRGTEKRRQWRQRCGLRRSRRMGGGLWPRGGKKR